MQPITLLATNMLTISYHGIAAEHTVAFDADGGTNTEGRFTFTVDGVATTVDCDDYATLSALVTAINAMAGWKCKPTPGLLSTMSTEASGLTQRVVSDLATTAVDEHGIKAMIFTNDYEVIAASTTTTLISSVAVPTGHEEHASLSHEIVGADAGATGDVTFNYVANRLGSQNYLPTVFPATDYEAAFDTAIAFTSPVVALNGNTDVKESTQQDLGGLPHIKILSVVNADDAAVNVQAWLVRP